MVGDKAQGAGLKLAESLRDARPGLRVQTNMGGGNFKAQFRRADKSAAELAVILGDNEIERGVVSLKPLRHEGEQTECGLDQLAARVGELLQLR
jgi:histidyl-tRNA synthetase